MGTETDSRELPWQPWQLWRTAASWEATAHLTQDLFVAAIGSSLILLVLGSLALLPLIPVGVPLLVMSLWLAAGAAGLERRPVHRDTRRIHRPAVGRTGQWWLAAGSRCAGQRRQLACGVVLRAAGTGQHHDVHTAGGWLGRTARRSCPNGSLR